MEVIRQRRLPKTNLTLQLPTTSAAETDRCPRFTCQPPTPPSFPSAGDHRLSDFDKIKVLGHGSGGTVYQVRHRLTGAIYALKALSFPGPTTHQRISREIEIHRRADSPAVVRFQGAVTCPSGDAALLLEHMDAGSLESRLPFPEPALAAITRQVLQGLSYLHSHHIVHRDIKPGNLLANAAGEVKITDFGVSKITRGLLDRCRSCVGTCAYMSPERFDPESNGGDYDPYAADVWSLGLTVMELRLGHFPLVPPGQRPDWATLMFALCFREPPELSEKASSAEFRDFIGRCLQKNPRKRWTVKRLLTHPFVAVGDQSESDRELREFISCAAVAAGS